jgi:hypothetical protein
MSETITNASVLGIKIDTQTTRLFLFDIVDGKYSLLATSEAASTHSAPYNDIREGLFKAIDNLQSITGRYLMDDESNLIIPTQEDGNGLDMISISYGFLNELSIIPAGLLEEVSLESNQNLLQLTHLAVLDSIKLTDSRSLEEIFTSIYNNHPNMVILSGGTFNGAIKSVVRLLEVILFCTKHLTPKEKPEIIYAGNSRLIQKLEEIAIENQLIIHATENLRPSLEVENLLPALQCINEVNNKMLAKRIPGLAYIFDYAFSQPIPYSQAIGTMVNFLSNLNPQKTENVLLIDFNKEIFTVAGNKKNQTKITKKKNLLTSDPELFLEKIEVLELLDWMNTEIDGEYVHNYVSNKSIHPNSLPQNKDDLSIEKSLLKFLLRDVFADYKNMVGIRHDFFHQILVTGDYLNPYFSNEELVLFLLDVIQPLGITNLFIDQYGILPILGSTAIDNSILPIHLLDSNTISLLAKVFSIPSRTRSNTPLLDLRIEFEDGSKLEETIVKGTIKKLPATAGQTVKLFVDVVGNIDIKSYLKPYEKGVRVQGGNLGIVFDTRNRPLTLPKTLSERITILNKWQEELRM